jgi:hypothetical protein
MNLVPAMIGVQNPRASHADPLPDSWSGQVTTIARHELDNEIPALLGPAPGQHM